MIFTVIVLLLTFLWWFVGGLVAYTDGLSRLTGVTLWGIGGGNLSHVMWLLGASLALHLLFRLRRRNWSRGRKLLAGTGIVLLGGLVATTPLQLEASAASMVWRRFQARTHPVDRRAAVRDLSLSRSIAAAPYLRRLMEVDDPQLAFDGAYGLALLSGGTKDPGVAGTLVDGADAVFDSEEVLALPVDSVAICQLFALTRDVWPARGALPRNTWATSEDFRKEWPEARRRFNPSTPLLVERLASLPSQPDPRAAGLVDRLDGPDAEAAELELRTFRPECCIADVSRALSAPRSPSQRVRLARLGRSIWSGRPRE
jgi:hypothetical protein